MGGNDTMRERNELRIITAELGDLTTLGGNDMRTMAHNHLRRSMFQSDNLLLPTPMNCRIPCQLPPTSGDFHRPTRPLRSTTQSAPQHQSTHHPDNPHHPIPYPSTHSNTKSPLLHQLPNPTYP